MIYRAGKLLLSYSAVSFEERGKSGDKISKFAIPDFPFPILSALSLGLERETLLRDNSGKNEACNSI